MQVTELASSIIGFITVVAQLSKATSTVYSTMKDALDDIQRIKSLSEDLQYVLAEIQSLPAGIEASWTDKAKRYWIDKSARLRQHFGEFDVFANGLKENQLLGKEKWFLSRQGRTKKLMGYLKEDLDVLRMVHQLMAES